MIALRPMLMSLVVLAATPAWGQKVLLIADDDAADTAVLGAALTNAGMMVTQTQVPSWQYAGNNPAPAGFDVIVLLAGTANARTNDMPAGGQNAILAFVGAGGGLVDTEWSAFQVSAGRWQTLAPLVLLARVGGTIGQIDYTVDPNFAKHPVWANLPASFSFSSASNVGATVPGPGVVRVATSNAAGDGVVIRDLLNAGRIVQVSTAGNYDSMTWNNGNLATLLTNSAAWASKSRVNHPPVANAHGPYTVPEGGSVMLSGTCTDPDMDAQTLAWDFNGNMLFQDAQGPNPVFSAAALAGPQTINVSLRCTDSGGLTNVNTTMVMVTNVPPVFQSMPPASAIEGTLYTYNAVVYEPGPNPVLTCSLIAGPMGMTVTANTCKVAWLPSYDEARALKQNATIQVSDKAGSMAQQSWAIATSFIDVDMDGLPDTWEMLYFGNLLQGPDGDPDMDGRPNLKEYQDGTDPTKYDGPSAPTIVSPDGGVHAPTAAMLLVTNALEPHGDPLVYDFEIYSDKTLQTLVDVNINVMPGQGATTSYGAQSLVEDTNYWWRCRARDPYIGGAWSAVATFFANDVHHAPTAPGVWSPLNQAKVKELSPILAVTNAVSSDEYPLTYTFELYGDAGLTMLVESQTMVMEGLVGTTQIQIAAVLTPYQHYFWRAKATDSLMLDGPWSDSFSFQVVPTNSPPSPPNITSPIDGARLATLTPTIAMGGSIDPEGAAINYICEVDTSINFDSMNKQVSPNLPPDAMDNASWTVAPLMETQHYCAHCRAADPNGTSGWTQVCFLIDVTNQPPSVPVLMNPSDGGYAASDVVRFTWANSVDPEGDAIHYEVEVYTDAALTERIAEATAGDGPTGATLIGLPPGSLSWRARAVDALGAASAWAQPNAFMDGTTADMGTKSTSGGCGCKVGGTKSGKSQVGLAMIVLILICGMRKRKANARPSVV